MGKLHPQQNFLLRGERSAKWREKLESEIGETSTQKLEGSCARLWFQIWEKQKPQATAYSWTVTHLSSKPTQRPVTSVTNRALSFQRKILPTFAGQFAKFHGSPQQNCPNSAAYCVPPFVSKLSSILLKNLTFQKLAWCSVMLATYKKLSIFFSKVQFVN